MSMGAPQPFFILGLHNTGTSTLVAMLNSHPEIFVAYETWGNPPLLTRYGYDLCRQEPMLRDIFDGRRNMVEAFAQAGRILQHQGFSYRWVGDKRVTFTPSELASWKDARSVYVWRPLEEWLIKREVRRAYATDFDAKIPALHFLSCLNVAAGQRNWLCLSMREIFQNPTAFFRKVANLLEIAQEPFDLKWWETAASPADPLKACMRWTDAHPSSLLPPQASPDLTFQKAEHPFWQAVEPIAARLSNPIPPELASAQRLEIEHELGRISQNFGRIPLAELYVNFEEKRHGGKPQPPAGLLSRLLGGIAGTYKKP